MGSGFVLGFSGRHRQHPSEKCLERQVSDHLTLEHLLAIGAALRWELPASGSRQNFQISQKRFSHLLHGSTWVHPGFCGSVRGRPRHHFPLSFPTLLLQERPGLPFPVVAVLVKNSWLNVSLRRRTRAANRNLERTLSHHAASVRLWSRTVLSVSSPEEKCKTLRADLVNKKNNLSIENVCAT